ncbi:MAG: T9SS type A sorting domain-containing protein [Saprospiraceae bacterium]|nr:T9SS type A sorting domain-containing protein [Candidatus Defluviibacterium haderslevense]MBK7242243.1 T9SS type A sorting domain-containing protein [Candidatus Defluviibacterium haderslevense]
MKKIFTSLLFFSFVWLVDAQFKVVQPLKSESAVFNKVAKTGFEPAKNTGVSSPKLKTRYPYDRSGITTYDLQSNGPIPNHLAFDANGNLVTAWTMSLLADGAWDDRGTGYNKFTAGAWDAEPTKRVENVRVGWGNIAVDAEGTEIIVSHSFAANNYFLNIARKKVGGSWVNTKMPTATPKGVLWPRATIGGVDNKTLHVIGVTTPTGTTTNGVVYHGVDGHVLYFRSPDGGVTWDIKDLIIPGLDSVDFARMDSDSYSLYAKGNTVAILMQTQWNDMSVYKSSDNGTTWTKTVIRKFPIQRYIYDSPYTIDDIGGVDTSGPGGAVGADEAAMKSIYTNDGSGNLTIDNNGKVHAFWGEMYVTDVTPGDGTSSYYPGRNGIDYWNEGMGANTYVKGIAGCLDENSDGTLNITGSDAIALYYTSLSSQPSATVDNDNNLYLAYSALSESNISSGAQNYRHIILTKSKDGGATWPEFVDVINDQLFKDDPTFYTFAEAVFPSVIIRGNDLHLTFMMDYEPGLTVNGDLDPSSENEMAHLIFDKNTLTLTEKVNKPSFFAMTLTPNVVNESTRVNFEVAKGGQAQLEVYSLTGQLMQTKSLGQIGSGVYNEEINLQHLTSGNYIIKLKVGVNSAAVKLVKI